MSTAAAFGFAFPTIIPSSALGLGKRPVPLERVTMVFIGTDNQSMNVMKLFLSDERVQVVAVGDVNKETPGYWDNAIDGREPAKRLAEEHYGDRGIRFRKPRLEQTRTARAAAPPRPKA